MRNRLVLGAVTALLAAGMAAPAIAKVPTAPGVNKLLCFDGTTDGGYGGICTLPTNGAKGMAVLDLTDNNPAGDYAGVYVAASTLFGQRLNQVSQLGYNYIGTVAATPTALSLNVPIDTAGDGSTAGYAFIDAYYCPGVLGVVDVVNDVNCGIWYAGVDFYATWAAFVAAFPTAKVADNYAFVIAERTPSMPAATWTVNNVKLGKGGH